MTSAMSTTLGEAASRSDEHADRDHVLRLLRERANVRICERLVAGDDEQLHRLGVLRLRDV